MLSSCHPSGGENTTVAKIVGSCLIRLVIPQKMVIQMTHSITQSLESNLPLGDKNSFRILCFSWGWLYFFFLLRMLPFIAKHWISVFGRGSFLSCLQSSQRCAKWNETSQLWHDPNSLPRLATGKEDSLPSSYGVPEKKRTTHWGFYHVSRNALKNVYIHLRKLTAKGSP